jgi:hypothetical protein
MEEIAMPEKQTLKRARKARRQGKSPSTQAGEFVREEIHHVREGKHGARSTKQAIAIGLSKARRAGVKLAVPKRASTRTKRSARSAAARAGTKPSRSRGQAVREALAHARHDTASHDALARQARSAARARGPKARRRAAQRAARTRRRRA